MGSKERVLCQTWRSSICLNIVIIQVIKVKLALRVFGSVSCGDILIFS